MVAWGGGSGGGGGSLVGAEKKFKSHFTFTNRAKMVFACNTIPAAQDGDEAFYDRWIIIPFPRQFTEGGEADRGLLRKLTTPEELSGLLNLALEERRALLERGGFDYHLKDMEKRRLYNLFVGEDSIAQYARTELVQDAEAVTRKAEVYADYIRFCKANDLASKEENAFHRRLKDLVYGLEESRPVMKGERVYAYKGVRVGMGGAV